MSGATAALPNTAAASRGEGATGATAAGRRGVRRRKWRSGHPGGPAAWAAAGPVVSPLAPSSSAWGLMQQFQTYMGPPAARRPPGDAARAAAPQRPPVSPVSPSSSPAAPGPAAAPRRRLICQLPRWDDGGACSHVCSKLSAMLRHLRTSHRIEHPEEHPLCQPALRLLRQADARDPELPPSPPAASGSLAALASSVLAPGTLQALDGLSASLGVRAGAAAVKTAPAPKPVAEPQPLPTTATADALEGFDGKTFNTRHTCEECGTSFSRANDLKRHRYTHRNNRPHECARCGKGFTRRDALERHTRALLFGRRVHCIPLDDIQRILLAPLLSKLQRDQFDGGPLSNEVASALAMLQTPVASPKRLAAGFGLVGPGSVVGAGGALHDFALAKLANSGGDPARIGPFLMSPTPAASPLRRAAPAEPTHAPLSTFRADGLVISEAASGALEKLGGVPCGAEAPPASPVLAATAQRPRRSKRTQSTSANPLHTLAFVAAMSARIDGDDGSGASGSDSGDGEGSEDD